MRVPGSVVDGGSGDHASTQAPTTFAVKPRNSSRGDGSLALGQGKRPPQATEEPVTPIDIGRMERCDGAKHGMTAANSSSDFVARVDGSTFHWSGIELEKVGGESLRSDSAEEVGSGGAETQPAGSDEQVTLPPQRAEFGARSSRLDQGDTLEEHPGWQGNLPLPRTARGISRLCSNQV